MHGQGPDSNDGMDDREDTPLPLSRQTDSPSRLA